MPTPSDEQRSVIESEAPNLSVNAFAGSGKTFTMVNYAKKRAKSRKLYICFNKTAQLEAEERFLRAEVPGVVVQTAHSLAYNHYGKKIKLFQNNPKTSDLLQAMAIPISKKTYPVYRQGFALFQKYLQSASHERISEYDFESDLLSDPQIDSDILTFFQQNEGHIRDFASKVWYEMKEGNIPLVHDFYLKWFQLTKPRMGFEYILFDEAQDANPAMLDIFFAQTARKVMIGDEHQSIYGWRGAINALSEHNLKKNGFERLYLSQCYRFGQPLADVAHKILMLKKMFNPLFNIPKLQGMSKAGKPDGNVHAFIGRTNSSLLEFALENVSQQNITPYYMEGGINNFSFFADGVSLYDVYNLYAGKRNQIRNPYVGAFKKFEEFKSYVIETGDVEFMSLVGLIERFKGSIFYFMKKLKTNESTREEAELLFTSCHRSKGLEYPKVTVLPDFINLRKLLISKQVLTLLEKAYGGGAADDVKKKYKIRWQNTLESIYQEINLLYVAVTRSKFSINYPDNLTDLLDLPRAYEQALEAPSGADTELTLTLREMLYKIRNKVELAI